MAEESERLQRVSLPRLFRRRTPTDDHDVASAVPSPRRPTRQAKALRPRRPFAFPRLRRWPAALVTGLVVGLIGVGLTWAGGRGCESVRGVGACGGVAGGALLVAVMSAMVLLGARLQRVWRVTDPVNSSFLAVGLVAVVVMLFLLEYDDQWFMWLVIPGLSAAAYVVSWWVTTTFIDRDQRG